MWIVAIAWIYVVGLMAFTETSIVAGVMTFLGYCVLPLSILFYITGGRRRREARANSAANDDYSDSSGYLFSSLDTSSDSDDSDKSSSSDSDSSSSSDSSDSSDSSSSSDD